jgi:hypothetical protein
LIDLVNSLTGATAAPAAVLINFIFGGTMKAVTPKLSTAGQLQAGPMTVAM